MKHINKHYQKKKKINFFNESLSLLIHLFQMKPSKKFVKNPYKAHQENHEAHKHYKKRNQLFFLLFFFFMNPYILIHLFQRKSTKQIVKNHSKPNKKIIKQ
jgi:hypothetical protein